MKLMRDGNIVDEVTYTRTTPAINKAQGITDRLAVTTPEMHKCILFCFFGIVLMRNRHYQ